MCQNLTFEQGPIRPPNEAASLLVRLTRNCPWNQCLFCPVYKGKKFSRRTVEEIKRDIDAMAAVSAEIKAISWRQGSRGVITREVLAAVSLRNESWLQIALWLGRGGESVFLQDADSLNMPAEQVIEVLQHLKSRLPWIKRITTYARSSTLARKTVAELKAIREAGLTRIHVGLESGYDPLLKFMKKGTRAEQQVEAGLKAKSAGFSLSEYVLLGLGGREMWEEHALATAEVLNRINPHFIRIRTLAVHPFTPLQQKCDNGDFTTLHDDEIVKEERLLIEHLSGITSYVYSDHMLNLLEEVRGRLPEDREKMLRVIDRYAGWSQQERDFYRLGRRANIFRTLDDARNPLLAGPVEQLSRQLVNQGLSVDQYLERVMQAYL